MAGRRRRRSVSSPSPAAVPDSLRTRWVKELEMLKPVDKAKEDEDEWPIFELNNATIYRKDGRTLANPLLVHVEGPLIVRGHVVVDLEDENQKNRLLDGAPARAYIEIPNATTYSIGDLPATIWVAGDTGWFEIRPSDEYKPIHDDALEATILYFTALDTTEAYYNALKARRGPRPTPPTLNEVLLKYAVRVGNGILRDEAEALCHKWAEFLISHFTREKNFNWDPAPFAKQMREWYPHIHKRVTATGKGIVAPRPAALPPPPTEAQEQQDRRSRSARASSRNSAAGPGRSRSPPPKPTSETPIPLPEKYKQYIQPPVPASKPSPLASTPQTTLSEAHSEAVDRLVEVLQEIAQCSNVKKSPATAVLSKIYFRCRMRQPPKESGYRSSVTDVCSYYAKPLAERLPPEWKGTPFLEWLKEAAAKPWTPILAIPPEEFPSQTVRRAKTERKTTTSTATPASELPPTINLKAQAKEAAAKDSDGDSGEETWAYNAPTRGRRAGKIPTLRLASSKKRPRADSDYYGDVRDAKTAKLSHGSDDDLDDTEDTSDEEVVHAVESRLPLPEGAVRLVVHAERIPSMAPTGPDDTWTCDQEGCGYVVRSALEQDAQEKIRAHFQDHEAQAEKIDLALKESRGHMPINHLIDKIQALGKASISKKQATLNGDAVPSPVKRRLLV
ncbi:hypothetical protein VTJ83DRAFT_3544 [Remersonia thermophila]|uniref:Uncharacterized protein n=1 Tax=Remersonia thermophila TaxID=72144 RepID=A0ABR4DE99_9PEZI